MIPTCNALLTLTDDNLRSSPRWLSEYPQTVAYLHAVLEAHSATLVNRVSACQTLLEVQSRVGGDLLSESIRDSLIVDLSATMADLSNVPWQEVMHFQVPSPSKTLSHYKLWIWTFPKLAFLLCFGRLSPNASHNPEYSVAAHLVENVAVHDGKVIFL